MTFNLIDTLRNTKAIPGIPNSTVIDPFGLGIAPKVLDMLSGGKSAVSGAVSGVKDKVSSITSNLPYIIIGGGTIFLIILLKR